jgi:hypothetical protein
VAVDVRRRPPSSRLAGLGPRAPRGLLLLEDPTRLEPSAREQVVEVLLPGGSGCAASSTGSTSPPRRGPRRRLQGPGAATLPAHARGWTTMARSVSATSCSAPTGRRATVTAKSAVHARPCYEVRFTVREHVVCDNVHSGPCRSRSHAPTATSSASSTQTLCTGSCTTALRVEGASSPLRPATAPLVLPPAELPVDPWADRCLARRRRNPQRRPDGGQARCRRHADTAQAALARRGGCRAVVAARLSAPHQPATSSPRAVPVRA